MNCTESSFLFTYGTLMRGFENPLLEILQKRTQFVGYGSMPGLLYQVSWYPGALYQAESDKKVYGEVFQLYDINHILSLLDDYEDVSDGLYIRKVVPILMENQTIVNCWAYIYNQSVYGMTPIEGGNFRKI